MVAKKKPRKGRKAASIAPLSRDSGRRAPRVAAALPDFSPVRAAAEPASFSPGLAAADLDALARSSVALADGAASFGWALIEIQRQFVAAGLGAARALIDAPNSQDVIEVQRRYVSGAVEIAVSESGGLARLASRVANETWAPLAPRFCRGSGLVDAPLREHHMQAGQLS